MRVRRGRAKEVRGVTQKDRENEIEEKEIECLYVRERKRERESGERDRGGRGVSGWGERKR